eukprot:5115210-Prymnesium_polylepis.1
MSSRSTVRNSRGFTFCVTGSTAPRTVPGCPRLSCILGMLHESRPCLLQRTRMAHRVVPPLHSPDA